MLIRRHITLRAAVIETAIIEDAGLSAAALGLYAYLAAAPPAGCATAAILARFGLAPLALDALLAELRTADLLDEDAAPRPMPPERRRRAYRKPWLPASAKLLLRTIADRADADGCATPINRDLVETTGLAERTVVRNLAVLEGKGLLRRETVDRGAEGHVRLIWVRDGQADAGEVQP